MNEEYSSRAPQKLNYLGGKANFEQVNRHCTVIRESGRNSKSMRLSEHELEF